MDTEAGRIGELVTEACALLQRLEDDVGAEVELEHLRAELRVLAPCTGDDVVADVACAVVGDIDAALAGRGRRYRDWAA